MPSKEQGFSLYDPPLIYENTGARYRRSTKRHFLCTLLGHLDLIFRCSCRAGDPDRAFATGVAAWYLAADDWLSPSRA